MFFAFGLTSLLVIPSQLGTGHYLSPGGGRSIFVVTSEHLPDPPVEYLVF